MLLSYPIAFVILLVSSIDNVKARPLRGNLADPWNTGGSMNGMQGMQGMDEMMDPNGFESGPFGSTNMNNNAGKMPRKSLDITSVTSNVMDGLQRVKATHQGLSSVNLFDTSRLMPNKNGVNGGAQNGLFNDGMSDGGWGQNNGMNNGWSDPTGMNSGFNSGFNNDFGGGGFNSGFNTGLNNGINSGWNDPMNMNNGLNDPTGMNNGQNGGARSPLFTVKGLNGNLLFNMNNLNTPAKSIPDNSVNGFDPTFGSGGGFGSGSGFGGGGGFGGFGGSGGGFGGHSGFNNF
ncbi:hypothetical protein BDF22DRAFT_669841 [Syncephalis plumigaleata]|nr:hypothetical protein BDF22DRAFT_669841 [Syncephalis plumigaleata]